MVSKRCVVYQFYIASISISSSPASSSPFSLDSGVAGFGGATVSIPTLPVVENATCNVQIMILTYNVLVSLT